MEINEIKIQDDEKTLQNAIISDAIAEIKRSVFILMKQIEQLERLEN